MFQFLVAACCTMFHSFLFMCLLLLWSYCCCLLHCSQFLADTVVSDIDEGRLRVAKEMGATYTVKVTSRDSLALAKEVESTLACQPQQTIECSGAEPSIATAIYVRLIKEALFVHGDTLPNQH